MLTNIFNFYVDKIDELSSEYAAKMAEGKQGRYFTQSFNANKRNYTRIAYCLYIKCYTLTNYVGWFKSNNINSNVFKAIDRDNYTKILADLTANNIIVVNNCYSKDNFSKSFAIHSDLLVHLNNCKRTAKLSQHINYTIIDTDVFKLHIKTSSTLPSIICVRIYN